jgi:hypothetical protein
MSGHFVGVAPSNERYHPAVVLNKKEYIFLWCGSVDSHGAKLQHCHHFILFQEPWLGWLFLGVFGSQFTYSSLGFGPIRKILRWQDPIPQRIRGPDTLEFL